MEPEVPEEMKYRAIFLIARFFDNNVSLISRSAHLTSGFHLPRQHLLPALILFAFPGILKHLFQLRLSGIHFL